MSLVQFDTFLFVPKQASNDVLPVHMCAWEDCETANQRCIAYSYNRRTHRCVSCRCPVFVHIVDSNFDCWFEGVNSWISHPPGMRPLF